MASSPTSTSSLNVGRWLWLILAIAVLLRVATAFLLGNQILILPSIADQMSYHNLALRWLGGYGFTFGDNWWPATRAGDPTAHWSYLYTLFLALIYRLCGPNPLAARLVQAFIGGLLMPWLVFRITRQVFSRLNPGSAPAHPAHEPASFLPRLANIWRNSDILPLLAAGWIALYGYFIYFGAALMTETFYISGILWTFDCALRIDRSLSQPPPENTKRFQLAAPLRYWLELGLAIAITAMLRQVFLPFVPFLFLWLAWSSYRRFRRYPLTRTSAVKQMLSTLLIGGAATGLVTILLIAPITFHNYRQFHSFVLLNTNAGYAFYWSNHPIYGERYVSILGSDQPDYYDLLPKEALWMDEAALDRELMRRGLGFVTADPIRYIILSLNRIPAYFVFWPLKTSSGFSNITRVASYGIAFPFIVAGIILWGMEVKRKRIAAEGGALLLLFALVYSLIHLLSWAGIRYRLPVDAATLPFAALALYTLIRWLLGAANREDQKAGPRV